MTSAVLCFQAGNDQMSGPTARTKVDRVGAGMWGWNCGVAGSGSVGGGWEGAVGKSCDR